MKLFTVNPTRKLSSWVDAFYEHTSLLPSPSLFRKWAGIATVAGALSRRVWVKTFNSQLFPNLYIIICSPPGVGKTVLTSKVQDIFSEMKGHFLAPSSVSRASLMDVLEESKHSVFRPMEIPPTVQFNSLFIVTNELATLIPAYEQDFMGTLTDIYDCKRYGEKKRTKDITISMPAPQINMLAATSPSYLNELMPMGGWDQGFISRVILVFSGETVLRDPFEELTETSIKQKDLVDDLRIIGELYGRITFDESAALALKTWHLKGGPPKPDHPKLIHYNTRRTAHLLKLCMVASVSRSNDLRVTVEDYQTALNWLLEAELYMSDTFKAMTQGGDSKAIEDIYYYVYQAYIKNKKPVPEYQLINFIQNRVPAHSVMRVLENMVRGGLLKKVLDAYEPLMRKQV